MSQNVQRLKTEIIAALDLLPFDSLKLLAEFVSFLRLKAGNLPPGQTDAQQEPQSKVEDPILQLGTHPIAEDVTDASIKHDAYLYSP